MISRRPFIALCFTIPALAGTPLGARPLAARPVAAPGVSVDVSRLRALGLGPTADLVAESVAAEIGGAVRPGGRIVVRVTGLSMNAYAGAEGSGGGGGGGDGGGGGGGAGENDYMEGEALLLGPAGEVLRRHPIVMSLPANSGGAYYRADAERRRVIELSRNFARWVKRDLG